MINHRITSQPWQLKAAAEGVLGAIILPLPEGWVDGSPENWPIKSLNCGFDESYCIYLAEKWCKCDWGDAFDDDICFVESATPEAEHIGWQPAETMPEEAARYWFEIAEVKVTQSKYLDYFTVGKTGFYCSHPEATYPSEEFKNAWDEAHPNHLWGGNLWVIVLEVRAINQ